ncbi:MAG TPA: lysophospholipid acyltransferase family protein [Anaerolineales bacterium]|nr:lysophospholipid acyltransferase family protein [Anaerolineales bacterium]
MLFSIIRIFDRLLLRLLARLEVENLENLPTRGAYIAVANHMGRLDAALVYDVIDRRDIIIFVAEKYRRYALIRWIVRQLDAIWLDRYNADIAALREVLARLKKGWALAMAPEGTRSKTGTLLPGRPGASYLAAKSGVLVIPVGGIGTEDWRVKQNLRRLRRTEVLLRVGKPFTLPPLPVKDREAALAAYTDEIMCQIAALLPPEQRGAYADHPRLKELLSGQD